MAFDITGGLRWHGRAFMRRKTLWQPIRLAIADWLAQTSPANKHLLLIGGSAGWMMSSDWLQRFQRIDLYDLDPLAGLLFRVNHGRALRLAGTKLFFIVAMQFKIWKFYYLNIPVRVFFSITY